MAENSKIEWTTHTLSRGLRISPKLGRVCEIVTPDAKRNAITSVEPKPWVRGEWPNVVGIEIPTGRISAMGARKPIAAEDIVAPAFQFSGGAQPSALDAFPVDVAGAILATRRILSRLGANLRLRFCGVFFAEPVAWPSLGCGAHFCPTFIRHALALHRRHEGCSSFQPAIFGGIASGEISHG